MTAVTFSRRGLIATIALALLVTAGALPFIANKAMASGLALDKTVSTHQTASATSITSPAFTTSQANELLVAFIGSDGPSAAGSQSISAVTSTGLTWKLYKRTNAQAGTAEIWTAVVPNIVNNVTVKATHSGSYQGDITVAAFTGANTTTLGAAGGGSAASGAPSASLTTTQAGSWVWGVGDDWANATARTVGANQTKVDEFLASSGDTFWTQRQSAVTPAAGTVVTLNDTAPTADRWDFSMIEILPAVSDSTPPTTPANLTATATSPSIVNLGWSASSDNVGVAGYKIFRNGTQIGTTGSTTYSDTSAIPGIAYAYTIQAYDAAGNVSSNSNEADVTTPADTTAPIISNIKTTSITSSSATITWTTDEASNSQVTYGTTASYDSATTPDPALVTSHSQNLAGLLSGTTYHYAVLSKDGSGNLATSSDATFATTAVDSTPPTAQMTAPTNGATVSGTQTVSASASDNVGVAGIQFSLDGTNLGNEVTTAPYSINWNSTAASNGSHTLAARARDVAGNVSTASVVVTVSNQSSGLAPALDPSTPAATAVKNNVLTTTSPAFSPPANIVLYAVFSMDSASYSVPITTVSSITTTGSPITWHLLGRNNNFSSVAGGFLEVWWAYNPTAQTNITSTATFNMATKNVTPPVGDFQILVMDNAAPDQSAAAWAASYLLTAQNNAPNASVTTTKANSLVFGIFDNWNNAQTPIPGAGQSIQSIVLNTADVDGYWLQKQNAPTAVAGTPVLMNATDPGQANQWRALAWEVLAAN